MPFNVLLIPLLGGYLFLSICYPYKFKLIRDDGQRLLFKSAAAGLISFAVSHVIVFLFFKDNIALKHSVDKFVSIPYVGTAFLSFILCIASAFLYNFSQDPEKIKQKLVLKDDDALEIFLLDALQQGYYVLITLQTNKIYIALITNNPFSIKDELKSIMILPFVSGYREEVTKKLVFTTIYSDAYQKIVEKPDDFQLTVNDFQIAIPFSQIVSVSRFEPEIYQKVFEE